MNIFILKLLNLRITMKRHRTHCQIKLNDFLSAHTKEMGIPERVRFFLNKIHFLVFDDGFFWGSCPFYMPSMIQPGVTFVSLLCALRKSISGACPRTFPTLHFCIHTHACIVGLGNAAEYVYLAFFKKKTICFCLFFPQYCTYKTNTSFCNCSLSTYLIHFRALWRFNWRWMPFSRVYAEKNKAKGQIKSRANLYVKLIYLA